MSDNRKMDNQQGSNKNHYVYITFTKDKAYLGVRSSNTNPNDDKYFGSGNCFNKGRDWSSVEYKWIYGEYNTRQEACYAEAGLIDYLNCNYDSYWLNKPYGSSAHYKANPECRAKIGSHSSKRNSGEGNPRYDSTIYTIYHPYTDTIISGTKKALNDFKVIDRCTMCKLIDGRIRQRNGWIFIEPSTTITEVSRAQASSKRENNTSRIIRYSLVLTERLREWIEAIHS